jgi:hypothetical protein
MRSRTAPLRGDVGLFNHALDDSSSDDETEDVTRTGRTCWEHVKRFFAAVERYTMHGKRGIHPYAFWLTVFCFVGGILNTTLTSVYYMYFDVPILGPRSKASLNWVFGITPDSPHTFSAALVSIALGMALLMCLFRLWLFQGTR